MAIGHVHRRGNHGEDDGDDDDGDGDGAIGRKCHGGDKRQVPASALLLARLAGVGGSTREPEKVQMGCSKTKNSRGVAEK